MTDNALFYYNEEGFLCDEAWSIGSTAVVPAEHLHRPVFNGEAWEESLIPRAWQLDENGFFVVDLFDIDPRQEISYTETPCPSGVFRKPRLVNDEWIEGAPVSDAELLEITRQRALKRANAEHLRTLTAGIPYNFLGTDDVIQTRHERDLINISGLATRALLLKADGVNESVIPFRADSNTTYLLTPDEMLAMAAAVSDFTAQQYSEAWALKDAINAAQSVAEIDAVQAP